MIFANNESLLRGFRCATGPVGIDRHEDGRGTFVRLAGGLYHALSQ